MGVRVESPSWSLVCQRQRVRSWWGLAAQRWSCQICTRSDPAEFGRRAADAGGSALIMGMSLPVAATGQTQVPRLSGDLASAIAINAFGGLRGGSSQKTRALQKEEDE